MDNSIAQYFARYPEFDYRPSRDWRQIGPFNALAKFKDWDQDRRTIEFAELKASWIPVVEREYAESSLTHYQNLCRDLDIDPIPETVNECKRQLKGVFVNIVDLTQYRRDIRAGERARKPTLFRSLRALRDYSTAQQKWYPPETAKSEMLRELLKVLQE